MPIRLTPWRAVAAAFALNGVLLGIWASRIPAVMADHSLGEAEFGVLLLMVGLGALMSFPLAGRLADSAGAVRVTRWIALVYVLSLCVVGVAPGVIALGVALFLFGACHGAMDVTMNSWATEVETHMARPVMPSFHAMWSLGAGLGAATGAVASYVGLTVGQHFILGALLAGACLGPALRLRWTSRQQARSASDPVFALPRGALLLVGVIALATGLGEGAVADWSAVYLARTVDTSDAVAALGYTVFSVAMVAMRLGAGPVIGRFGAVPVARISALTAAAGIALLTTVPVPAATFAGLALMGLGYAALMPLAFSRAAADPHLPPGQAIAAVATLGYGAMLLGPPAIGVVAEIASLRVAFVGIGVIAVAAAVLTPVLDTRR